MSNKGLEFFKTQLEQINKVADVLGKTIDNFDTTINTITKGVNVEDKQKLDEVKARAKAIFKKAKEGKEVEADISELKEKFKV